MLCRMIVGLGVWTLMACAAQAGDWPMFRGPLGTGISEETGVPINWGPDKNIRWKADLPGDGNSSPIVSAGRVFVTTATDEGKQRTLHCFDRTDGRELWSRTVEFPRVEPTHRTNPYAGSTPAADGERVVVWHGSAGLHCYDFEGNELWSKTLGEVLHIWGFASSPVIYGKKIILNHGPGEQSFMAAIDLGSGELLWKTDEPGGASGIGGGGGGRQWIGSWSTPVIVKVDGKDQIICTMPTRVAAYDPQDGRILWYCEGLANAAKGTNLAYASPQIGENMGVAMGGFSGPAFGFRLGGSGDVTETNRLWHVTERNPQRIGSGVVLDGRLYIANAGPGTAECIDVESGEQLWQARMPGGTHWGSVIYADGRLYVTDQQGTTHVFQPNPERLELIASNRLGEPSDATPAVSDGELFLRTTERLYCIAE